MALLNRGCCSCSDMHLHDFPCFNDLSQLIGIGDNLSCKGIINYMKMNQLIRYIRFPFFISLQKADIRVISWIQFFICSISLVSQIDIKFKHRKRSLVQIIWKLLRRKGFFGDATSS